MSLALRYAWRLVPLASCGILCRWTGVGVGGFGGDLGTFSGMLSYGDRFYLATNPSLRVDSRTGMVAAPYLLSSELANAVAGAGKGDAVQDVVMTLKTGAHAEWKYVAPPHQGPLLSGYRSTSSAHPPPPPPPPPPCGTSRDWAAFGLTG